MDFELSEEQIMLQRTCREFAEKEVRPISRELDRMIDPGQCYSMELIKKASKLGLRTTGVPKEYGGVGLDLLTQTIMWEELAWGDIGFAFSLYHTIFFGRAVPHMPKEIRDEFLPRFLEDDTFLLAYSLSEPRGMTEVVLAYEEGGFDTFAEKKGDEYVINGNKLYCSNSTLASIITVSARTIRKGPLTKSWSRFLVPVGTPGLTIGKVHDHMGLRMLMTAELAFEDMHVPAKYLIGEENKAYHDNLKEDPIVITLKNTNLLGGLRALYEESLNYARTRVVCGKPIIEYDTIKLMLADMRTKLDAARWLIRKCAWDIDHHSEDVKGNNEMAYATKAFVNEISPIIVRDADEIHGGMGTSKELIVEKIIRDVITIQHGMCNRSVAYLKGAPTLD
jgi:acyl-CoA dehydrogenase